MLNQLLTKLERKFGRFAIPHLMSIILVGMVVIFCFDILTQFNPNMTNTVSSLFAFDLEQIKQGQIWRVISFVFLPPATSILFAVFEFYFVWLIGTALENQWGSFKFNIYYLIGIIGTVIVGFCTGYATNIYLNLSMFLAFAILFPEFEVYLFFFIPIKIKWIGLADGILLLVMFIAGGLETKLLLHVSVLNLVLFFGKDFFSGIYYRIRKWYYQQKRRK